MFYSDSIRIQPELTENAMRVLRKRYLRGETPAGMFWRVASAIAESEKPFIEQNFSANVWASELDKVTTQFYNLMATLDFLPNSPTLMNAGRPLGQLSGCFVIPVEDSMEGIFQSIKDMAMIQKSGGGTGFNFSKLRPKNDPVTSTVGEASGPVSFMHAFNACTEVVKQGGSRRGANMGILRIDHPDILSFIEVKGDLSQLTNFNMSVAVTTEFMKCLIEKTPFTLKFKDTVYAKVDARDLWDRIIHRAWSTGEPGIIFIDRINEDNPTPNIGAIESTNPCGEQPLLPYESCNLGSINLANMVRPHHHSNNVCDCIDWGRLRDATWLGTQFLDDVIDINHYPLSQIEAITKANRKIGLGVMGWADMLYQLELGYDTEEARELAATIMRFIQNESHSASMELASWKGTFPNYEGSVWDKAEKPMRNAATITIAPTGTLSVVAGVSSGIEPNFGISYKKELTEGVTAGGTLKVINKYLEDYMILHDYGGKSKQEITEIISNTGTLQHVTDELIPIEVKNIFKVASDIDPLDHIRMQAAFQLYVDNAVSKTINFGNNVTEEDIGKAMLLAYELGCKGVTVYRDGSRSSQPLTKNVGISTSVKTNGTSNTNDTNNTCITDKETNRCINCRIGKLSRQHRKRLTEVPGVTSSARTGCGSLFITINEHENEIYEVFLRTGNSGGCTAFTDGTARLISIALRYGVPAEEIIEQLNDVRCDNFRHQTGKDPTLIGKSCPDVIGTAMAKRLAKLQKDKESKIIETDNLVDDLPAPVGESTKELCPDCGEILLRSEGCIKCNVCGYSRC